jgi:diguanylate cyclase (GGDEF)-like protein/PAS domain S-box-containing protein
LLRAAACGLLGLWLLRLFRAPPTEILGRRRWLVVGAMFALGGFQLLLFALALAGFPWVPGDTATLAAGSLLLFVLGFCGFLGQARRRLSGAVHAVIQARLDEAEMRAREARQWLLMAEEIANVGHWRISLPDHRLFWSDGLYRIHGLGPEEFDPGVAAALRLLHEDDRLRTRKAVEHAIATGEKFEFAVRVERPEGEIRHVQVRGCLERDAAGTAIGVFGVMLDMTDQKLTEEKLQRANAASAAANEKLRELAMADSLTGLPNRRHFDSVFEIEFRRAVRERTALGLVMVDIDYFKAYNDIYGHPAGDECLRRIAAAIAAVPQRPADLAARYGGEELVLLLPGATLAGAEFVAQRLVEAVRALEIAHDGGPGLVTVSCGVAVFEPGRHPAEPLALLQRADRALYKAKHSGRDRVCRDGAERVAELAR